MAFKHGELNGYFVPEIKVRVAHRCKPQININDHLKYSKSK